MVSEFEPRKSDKGYELVVLAICDLGCCGSYLGGGCNGGGGRKSCDFEGLEGLDLGFKRDLTS